MRCNDCMFFKPSETTRIGIFPTGKTDPKCSVGVEIYNVAGYGAFPGPPYNPARNPYDIHYDVSRVVAEVCPNFRPL